MIGRDTLNNLGKSVNGKFKKVLTPLLKDGIGDKMDKGNLWIIPGFTLLAFAVLWTTKLSTTAFAESTCKGASIYDLGPKLELDAQRHCETAKRYYKEINEPFQYDQAWREARQVKNPEWILWFWAPIVFVMYVLTRFAWTLLMENHGINFNNVVNASSCVTIEVDGVTKVDDDKLNDKVSVIADNFGCATSSHVFAAFIWFEISLVVAPCVLLIFILPIFIGASYRTWGLDVARTWWEKKEWQGSTLTPFFGSNNNDTINVPLIPRYTYCDYHWNTLGNDQVLTYRCYLDANWHERTALFTWYMLVFLIFINLCNLFFWLIWAIKMYSDDCRENYVKDKWLNDLDLPSEDKDNVDKFAKKFKMGNLLLFYFIEAHTDRVVASAFAKALFDYWMSKNQENYNHTYRVHYQPTAPPLTPDLQQSAWEPAPTNGGAWDDPDIGVISSPGPSTSNCTPSSHNSMLLLSRRPIERPPITNKEKYRNKGTTSKSAAADTKPPAIKPPETAVMPYGQRMCTLI